MQELESDVKRIGEYLSNFDFGVEAMVGTTPDQEVVDWYVKRFDMFVEDGCPKAIQPYLERLLKDDCNQVTKLTIMSNALSR